MASTSEAGERSLHVPESGELNKGKKARSVLAFEIATKNVGFSTSSGSALTCRGS